ncbi:MAG TPA: DUF2092 domain-containing protein [Candidatus Binatia bacterium]|jgi:hypothetical protein|nr:DUF2092 domain-containing protein [Candidatus Binatia bacterium]
MMRLGPVVFSLVLALGACVGGLAHAKDAAKKAAPPIPHIDAVIEPKATAMLQAMSAKLAAAKTLRFNAVSSYESPSIPGPALVYMTLSEVTLQRPDKLVIVSPGDGPASEFYYDGKVMMAYAPAENMVAIADAPPTIDAMLKAAYQTADIYFPFTDLIVADPYKDMSAGLKWAFVIGQSKVVGGVTTDVVAIANEDVFVQLWIGADDKLPRMARAVFRDDPSRLRQQVTFSDWKLDDAVAAEAFASTKASGAQKIGFARPELRLPSAPAADPKAKK